MRKPEWLGDSTFIPIDRQLFTGTNFDRPSGRGGWPWRAHFQAGTQKLQFAIGPGERDFMIAYWAQTQDNGRFSTLKIEFDDGRKGRLTTWRRLET